MVYYKNWSENGQKGVPTLLNLNSRLLDIFRQTVDSRLQVTWNWLYLIMDQIEAKLKFGSALTGALIDVPVASTGPNDDRDICAYFLSLQRSHSSEDADHLPPIEYDAIRTMVFVLEAYLFHVNVSDQLNLHIQQLKESDERNIQVFFCFF